MIDIKLDTHAVRQLFPEGTAARAQLQQSVINNIVKEMVLKNSQNKIKEAIQTEISATSFSIPDVRSEVNKEVKKMFEKQGWNGMSASEELTLKMNSAAEVCAHDAIDKMIKDLIDSAVTQAESRIQYSLFNANRRIQDIVVKSINDNFSDIINKAIAAKLEQHFPVKTDV